MYNEIQRKITSLTLMTIMLAGGMTVAFPGFTPDAYAANANLIVSAEDTGSFDGAQVIEISIIDNDLDNDASPQVTLNGETVTMTRATDAWYAYIANDDAVLEVDNGTPVLNDDGTPATDENNDPVLVESGIDFGVIPDDRCGVADSGAVNVYCDDVNDVQNVPASERRSTVANWPFIQTYDFSSVTIQYNKAGGTQTTTLEYDNNDVPGLSLDRDNYPQGAHVHISIDDQRLNIDPTGDDYWSWNITDMDNVTKYYGKVASDGAVTTDIIETPQVCEADCVITIDYNRNSDDLDDNLLRLDPESFDDVPNDGTWFVVGETGGPNTGIFTATDLSDNSLLRVTDDASRDASASITYDGTETGIDIKFNTATIDITSPGDVWTSGSAIPIVVVDNDANKNSRADDDLSVSDINSIVPTLVTGDPFTLSEISDEIIIWIGVDLVTTDPDDPPNDVTTEYQRLIDSINDPENSDPNQLLYEHGYTAGFRIGGIFYNSTSGDWERTPGQGTADDRIGIRSVTTVEEFSNRGIVSLPDINAFTEKEKNSLRELLGITTSEPTDFETIQASILAFDIGNSAHELRSSLIDTRPDSGETGFNMINYNFDVFEGTPSFVLTIIDGNYMLPPVMLGQKSGYTEFNHVVVNQIFGYDQTAPGFTQLAVVYPDNLMTIEYGKEYPVILDLFSFGYKNDGEASDERIANQIIRFELEENGDAQGSFEGTLEYIMINQVNINEIGTYEGITPISDTPSFIVIEDLTSGSAPSVTYLDVDINGDEVQVSAQEDAPSHTGVVTLDVESFKAGDTVTVTLEDLDLNTNPDLTDRYTVVSDPPEDDNDGLGVNHDVVGVESDIGRLLEITFNDKRWTDYDRDDCAGLGDSGFTLSETGASTGIFVGTFAIPDEICIDNNGTTQLVTGLDIEVNYVDFRDRSGEITEIGASAGVKASTGSVSLDRTVYPVPFGVPGDFVRNDSSTPSESNSDTRSVFPIHQSGINGDGIAVPKTSGLDAGEFLPQGDLIVYVTVTDPDFDVSASGRDSIELEDAPVTVSVIRGSDSVTIATVGDEANPIDEIAPDAGIFESSVPVHYYDGPEDSTCPSLSESENTPPTDLNGRIGDHDNDRDTPDEWITSIDPREDYCILQGDILQVEYRDPIDASGQPNTVTDSATFDLRNGVLQSDKSVYIIGSDMILTLIEPDLDLDSSQDETYSLDLIEWSSSAATVTMGNADDAIGDFDPTPLSFRETGPSTGIFQVVIGVPQALEDSSLQRGEEVDLEYTDWGPSGSDYVGDQDEDIRLTVFTSNFGATIDLDQKVYSWTDKVYITVVAPDHNFDDNQIDEIGEANNDPLRVATKGFDLDDYRLVETGFDTGIFTGEVILTGFDHSVIDYTVSHETGGEGPTSGYLETPSEGGISVSYEYSEDETVFTSSIIRWNIGDVQWLEASYPASGTGVLRVIDPDMNLNPEAVDNFDVNIASNTDASGITLTVTETNEATGIFEGTVFFTTTGGSSGHRLRISEGDTVTADYGDGTLPSPYTASDSVSITSTTIIGTIVPPLERAPATNLRIIDSFGSSIDAVSVDQQVQVTADLVSGQDRDQDFAYLIQIQDGDGVTVALSWIAGALVPGQSFSPSASWTPTDVGTYTVTAFVWESIGQPTALSPPLSIDVSVN